MESSNEIVVFTSEELQRIAGQIADHLNDQGIHPTPATSASLMMLAVSGLVQVGMPLSRVKVLFQGLCDMLPAHLLPPEQPLHPFEGVQPIPDGKTAQDVVDEAVGQVQEEESLFNA